LLLLTVYQAILKETDKEYYFPGNVHDIKNLNFKKIRWKNPKIRNFLAIMKVLAERGACTAHEITDFDGFSDRKKDRENRQKIYSRIIEGSKTDKVNGLISKRLVKKSGSIKVPKPAKKYKLTIFGILYVIHIFSCYTERSNGISNKPLIEHISQNYSDALPLIFGKWNFLKKNLFDIKVLEDFSNKGDPYINLMEGHPYIDEFANRGMQSSPKDMDDYIEPELNMIFFSNQFKDPENEKDTIKKFRKDNEIFRYYSEFARTLFSIRTYFLGSLKKLNKAFQR